MRRRHTPRIGIACALVAVALIAADCASAAPPMSPGTTTFDTRLFQIEGTLEQWVVSGCATTAGCGVVIDLTNGTQRWRIIPDDVGPSSGLPPTLTPGDYLVGFSWRRYLTDPVAEGDHRDLGDLVAWCQTPFTVKPDQVSVLAAATHDARNDTCTVEIHET